MLLPRDISTVHILSVIEKIHGTIAVGGHLIRAHAPNVPATNRCNQCEQLGHAAKDCALYDDIAVRLIFSRAVPYHFLLGLVKDTTARNRRSTSADRVVVSLCSSMVRRRVTLVTVDWLSSVSRWLSVFPPSSRSSRHTHLTLRSST